MILTLLVMLGAATAAGPVSTGPVVTTATDPLTHHTFRQVSGFDHAENLYFHVSNFTADNSKILFAGTISKQSQLWLVDPASGELHPACDHPAVSPHSTLPHPKDPNLAYAIAGPSLVEIALDSGRTKILAQLPETTHGGYGQPTLSVDLSHIYLSHKASPTTWEIGKVHLATGRYTPILSQGFAIGHLQHSPTDPHVFYVWETGGFAPQRTWLVNDDGSANRPLYAPTLPKAWITEKKEWITHESWIPAQPDMLMINDKIGILRVTPSGNATLVAEGQYWHAAASPDGRSLVADDFDGRLHLLPLSPVPDSKTRAKPGRILVGGLRGPDRKTHPHAAYDRLGYFVEFQVGGPHPTIGWIDLRSLPDGP